MRWGRDIGAKSAEAVRESVPDLLLLDLMLPG
jgi:DNA-binding response OmpR family regulator